MSTRDRERDRYRDRDSRDAQAHPRYNRGDENEGRGKYSHGDNGRYGSHGRFSKKCIKVYIICVRCR